MALEAESTTLSTALKSRTSTDFTEFTAGTNYEFDTPHQETMNPKEPWNRARNSLDQGDFAPDTIPEITEQEFGRGQTMGNIKADKKRYNRFENESKYPENADQVNDIKEDMGSNQGPHEPSQQRSSFGYAPDLRRRCSMEEDMHYQRVMVVQPRQPPPSYSSTIGAAKRSRNNVNGGLGGTRAPASDQGLSHEMPPDYYCDINLEGVFMCKMEIEHVTKHAKDRQWRMIYATLHGTALNIYSVKGRWQWRLNKGYSNVNPDNPPWIVQGRLEKGYSLLHSDCGIAADYKK